MLRVFLVRSRPPWSMFPHADPALPCASGRAQNLALFCACWAVPFLSCLIAISLDRLNFENSQINLTFHGKNLGPRFPVFFLRKVIRWPLLWISGKSWPDFLHILGWSMFPVASNPANCGPNPCYGCLTTAGLVALKNLQIYMPDNSALTREVEVTLAVIKDHSGLGHLGMMPYRIPIIPLDLTMASWPSLVHRSSLLARSVLLLVLEIGLMIPGEAVTGALGWDFFIPETVEPPFPETRNPWEKPCDIWSKALVKLMKRAHVRTRLVLSQDDDSVGFRGWIDTKWARHGQGTTTWLTMVDDHRTKSAKGANKIHPKKNKTHLDPNVDGFPNVTGNHHV